MMSLKPSDPDPGFPCKRCAVRPDVDCQHRPADPVWSMGPSPPDADGRRHGTPRPGNGHNFRARREQITKARR